MEATTAQRIERISREIVSAQGLAREGFSHRGVSAALAAGELVRLRKGWYLRGAAWQEARGEDRHLAALIAARRSGDPMRVYSHRSAATLLGLPVWSRWAAGGQAGTRSGESDDRRSGRANDPRIIHTIAEPGASSSGVVNHVRHRAVLGTDETVMRDGFTCTSPERTLYDLARVEPFPIALACADHWLNREFSDRRLIDRTAWGTWRTRMLERAHLARGGRGVCAVRALARLANPRSESVLESVSRLRLLQSGIDPELQVAVPSEDGRTAYVDFLCREHGFFGECDGKVKYFEAELLGGRSAEEVFWAEKRRHDWASGVTGLIGARWDAGDTRSRARFQSRLTAFGIRVSERASKAYGAETAAFLERLP